MIHSTMKYLCRIYTSVKPSCGQSGFEFSLVGSTSNMKSIQIGNEFRPETKIVKKAIKKGPKNTPWQWEFSVQPLIFSILQKDITTSLHQRTQCQSGKLCLLCEMEVGNNFKN